MPQKEMSVPPGTIDERLRRWTQSGNLFDRPWRDEELLKKTLTQHSVLGYFHRVPGGTIEFLSPRSCSDACKKKDPQLQAAGPEFSENDLERSLRMQPIKPSVKEKPWARPKAWHQPEKSKLCGGDDASSEHQKPPERPMG
jgi:hypothetical protein